jgi:hypothetical protein
LRECSLRTYEQLLEIIDKQNELIAKLVNETFEQESFISELMREKTE